MAHKVEGKRYLDNLVGVKPGEHVGYISGSFHEWQGLIIPFLLGGVKNGEQSIYLNDLYTTQQVWSCLHRKEPPLTALRKPTSMMVLNSPSFFFLDRCFDPWGAVCKIARLYKESRLAGFETLRLVADMNWVSYCALYYTRFLEYESLVERFLLPHYSCTLVCQFDRALFSKQMLESIINTHRKVIKTESKLNTSIVYKEFTNERIILTGL